MTLLTTVIFLPDEPLLKYRAASQGFVVDPQTPPVSGTPQPMVGGRLLYLSDGKLKALPEATP